MRPKSFWMRKEDVQRDWYHVDATDQTLGKVAVRAAMALMGKHKPTYTPGVDVGNFVVVTNAEKVSVSGQKVKNKVYRYHTGYVGGLVEQTYEEIQAKKPEKIVQLAIRRMLPKNKLGRVLFKRLKVYVGPDHPHVAQNPQALSI